MSCTSPILAYNLGKIKNDEGRWVDDVHIIKLKPTDNLQSLQSLYGSNFMTLPCGKCLSCRKTKAEEWSLRCYLESLQYKDNSFITLTYDDEHNPGVLVKSHVQKFFKALRNLDIKFRYFCCGEYGEMTKRPHYHILIFGWIPSDLIYHSKTGKGSLLFESPLLQKVWPYGFSSVGLLSPEACCYTARYSMKKIGSYDDYSKEFILMSRRPGLGNKYVVDNIDKLLEDGQFYLGNFGIKNFPRYVRNILNDYDPWRVAELVDNKAAFAKAITNHQRYLTSSVEEELLKQRANDEIDKLNRKARGF